LPLTSVRAQPTPKVSCGRPGTTPLPPMPVMKLYLMGFALPSEVPKLKNIPIPRV
jgi:hypothetical protein